MDPHPVPYQHATDPQHCSGELQSASASYPHQIWRIRDFFLIPNFKSRSGCTVDTSLSLFEPKTKKVRVMNTDLPPELNINIKNCDVPAVLYFDFN